MSDGNAVLDGFESYYTEKLWQLVPEVYRNEDGLATNPGVLRRIVELIGAEAARSRRSIDRLWEDQHIETCDDWAVPYIGDLVGARLVSAHDRRARRVDVANAIKFRRRRGTPDLLDSLVRAMSGWDVVLVEGFRRLARTRHRLDPRPRAGGFFTGTLTGGTADLRNPAGAELSEGPFDEYFHTLDARLLRGRDGRFGVNKLNFHLFRLRAYEMTEVDPVELTDPDGEGFARLFTVDPSGRDIPLFIDAEPPDPDAVAALPGQLSRPSCGQPLEWEITHAMRCRLLGHVAYRITASIIEELRQLSNPPTGADESALFQLIDVRFGSEQAMRRRLQDLGAAIPGNPPDWYRALVALGLLERTGKANLYPAQVEISSAGDPLTPSQVSSANLADRDCQPDPEGVLAELLISPEQGRFASIPPGDANFDPLVERYHYGFSGDVGAGSYPRDPVPPADAPARVASGGTVPDGGVLQGDGLLIDDNRTYTLSVVAATPVDGNAVLQAGPQRRPYVLLDGGAANLAPQAADSVFLIDGGWYGVNDPGDPPAVGEVADFVIEGAAGLDAEEFDFERVEIRFATFDPGGLRADGVRIAPLRLLVRARIRRLVIRRSIMGPIHVFRENDDDPSLVEELLICESIVDARESAGRLAVSSNFGTVIIEGSTIFGDVAADVLRASDTIVDGSVRVVNNQAGCFRFSASEPGAGVRLPPRYRDVLAPISESAFNSTRFGDPQYAQLSVVAPAQLTGGAENGSEMGVFSHLLTPIRLTSVRAKVNEYGPVGLLAQYLFEGDYLLESLVRFGVLNPEPEPSAPPPPPDPGDLIPEPPPPPPEPLPTACPDEGQFIPPTDEPPEPVEPVVIDLATADINGAPGFWRGVDWREDTFPAPPEGEPIAGIPFDRVTALLEYDARFGTLPAEQGWTPNDEGAAQRFRLDDHRALLFELDGGPAFFTAEAGLERESPTQLHAYVNLFLDQIPDAQEGSFDGFTQLVEANHPARPFRGLRADWARSSEREEFHYVTLDGRGRVGSARPDGEPGREWHAVSLQATYIHIPERTGCLSKLLKMGKADAGATAEPGDESAGCALVSLDGQVEEFTLKAFGEGRGGPERAALRAVFGFAGKAGSVVGRLRNFVVSSPGRYLRAWMRAQSPSAEPVLQLGFVTQERATAGVRFRVRYGSAEEGETALPLRIAEGTLKLEEVEAGRETRLEIPLPAARRGDNLLLTLERDSLHPEDTLPTSIRLVSAALAAGPAR
jgi:hypothetical protein